MPATFIGSATSHVPGVSHSTLHYGSILTGDIICVCVGSFGLGFPCWKITDNLSNGSAVDPVSGDPMYAKGASQYGPGNFQKTLAFWAVSLIDGDLTISIDTYTGPNLVTPFVLDQLNVIRIYRFPKVYAIAEDSAGIGGFTPGGGFNTGYGSGPFTYADTLVVTSVMSDQVPTNVTSLTGDTLQNDVHEPFTTPHLLVFDRSSTGPGNGDVRIKYNVPDGPGSTSMAVMTFSIPLADPGGLRSLGGRQYAARGGAGFDDNPGYADGDQQADWNRPIVCTFPYEVKVGDLLLIDVHTFNNPDVGSTPYGPVWDEYGPGFPVDNFPPLINSYTREIICPPTGSGSGGVGGYTATYTCMVDFIPVQRHPGWQAGGVFQVHVTAPVPTTSAVYQCTAIGITAITVAGAPTNVAVAGLKSVTQIVQDGLIASDVIPSVPAGTYLHAFAVVSPSNAMTTMTWTAMESYTIPTGAHWDFFQFAGQITNATRVCGVAIMDKIAPVGDDYDAQVTAVLPGFGGGMVIILLAVTLPSRLTLVKEVVDGTASASDWTLSANGPTPISGAGGVVAPVDIGAYDLSESPGPAGYTASDWVCVGGTQTGPSSVEIGVGDDVVCTITNTATAPPPPPPPATAGKSMRYQIPQKRWFPHSYEADVLYHYLDEPRTDQPNDMQLLMLAGDVVLKSGGNTDDGTAIQSIAQLPSNDGGDQRIQKLYVDSIVDADSVGGTEDLAVTLLYDSAVTTGPTYTLTPGSARAQFIQNISSLVALGLHRNIAPRFAWTGGPDGPRIYAYEPAGFAQPYISKFFVTQFITLAFSGWKHTRRCYPALISTAEVIFTIKTQDGRTYVTTIPSTGGQFLVQPLMIPQDCKDLSFAFQLDGQGSDFAFFPADFTVEFKEWQQPEYIRLAVFQT